VHIKLREILIAKVIDDSIIVPQILLNPWILIVSIAVSDISTWIFFIDESRPVPKNVQSKNSVLMSESHLTATTKHLLV
jgi:hypothetical protein